MLRQCLLVTGGNSFPHSPSEEIDKDSVVFGLMRWWYAGLDHETAFECLLYWNETGDMVNAFARPLKVHMSMVVRDESKDSPAPVWTASHGPRSLAHLLSSREIGVGERGFLEAVCQRQRLSARDFGPV